jgi:hypothetical protein
LDFGIYLILCAFVFASYVVALYMRKGAFALLGILLGMVTVQTAIADSDAAGGKGFVVSQALSSSNTYILRYQPLIPALYIVALLILFGVMIIVTKRSHFI